MRERLNSVHRIDNIVSTTRDLRIIENLKLELHELSEENERLNKLLNTRSQFIRLVTHELKSPIAAVENYLKLILQGYINLEDQDKILEKCIVRTCEERQLIDDLLDLGRIEESGSLPVVPVHMDLVLQGVLSECQEDVLDKNLHLTLNIGDDIPRINAVPELAKSIWCNLVSNALKYTPDGGEIRIGLKFRNQALFGWIKDSGIGISAEDQKKIFREFFRGENARISSIAGTGLGLVLVKKIVERLGGNISFESDLGVGSTFQFMIPTSLGTQISPSLAEQN